MVLDGHISGGDVNKCVSLSDFRALNILPKHTFKAKPDIENWFYIVPYFFFSSAFPPTDFPISASAAMFSQQLGIPVFGMSELLGS